MSLTRLIMPSDSAAGKFHVLKHAVVLSVEIARRACPGRYFADQSLFLLVASILSVFKISPPRDEQGNQVPLKLEQMTGLIS
jgi:hypothetical protein